MHHIILSTLDHHRLASEPRVTLEFHPSEQEVRIAYCRANLYFHEPLSEERVPVSSAVACVLEYLRRLWAETKAPAPIPKELSAT